MTQVMDAVAPEVVQSVMRAISRAAPDDVPGVAGLLDTALEGLLKKRRARWHRRFADAVAEIGKRVDETALAALCRKEHFLTIALEAAQIAWRNHSEEKLEALKWAVVHAALPEAANEEVQFMYLRYVDELTPAHLVVVSLLDQPERWMQGRGIAWPSWRWGTASSLIQYCVPALRGQPEAIEQVVRELQFRALVDPAHFVRTATAEGELKQRRTTGFGRTFVANISGV